MAVATGTALLIGGALGAGASMIAANQQADAIKDAARAQTASADESVRLQLQFLREQRADIAEAVDEGLIDLETGFNMAVEELQPLADLGPLNQARALLEDPSALAETPAFKFQFGQGIEALQAAASRTSGGGLSGPLIKAAEEFGQGLASQSLNQALSRLQPFIDIAAGTRANIANLRTGEGTARANLRLGGATGTAGVTGPALPAIAQGITRRGDIAAQSEISRANVATQLLSNLTGTGSNMLALALARPDLFRTVGSGVGGAGLNVPRSSTAVSNRII